MSAVLYIAANSEMENLRESHLKEKKHRRVVLFPLPLEGHLNPMLQLANVLYSKGFSIDIIHTHFNPPDQSNFPDFDFHPIPEGLSEDEAAQSTDDGARVLKFVNDTHSPELFRDALAKLLSVDNNLKEPIACLITDSVLNFVPVVAESLRLPWVALVIGSATALLAAYAFPDLHQKGYMPRKSELNRDSHMDDPVTAIPYLKVRDLPELEPELFREICHMARTAKASSGIIINTVEELEQSALSLCGEVFQIPVYHVGPLHKYFPASSNRASLLTQDQTSISWLDKQEPNSVLYVSFGSLVTVKETEFLEIAWGLANSKQPFLWVVRTGLVEGSEWIEILPKEFHKLVSGRGHIVKWAPQKEVLAHPAVGGFWTHCGWNSLLESICEGVPMILHPDQLDQTMNARLASDAWKVGIHLEDYKKQRGDIEKAIKTLMEDKGHEIRKKIASLKEKVNSSLREGGSSYQSLNYLISLIMTGLNNNLNDSSNQTDSNQINLV